MIRAKRLLALINILSKTPVLTAAQLAHELKVSERTVYRDINTLREEGAHIHADAEGFTLRAGWLLPPVNLTPEEVEALTLGARWVTQHADPALQRQAEYALNKLSVVLSSSQQKVLYDSPLLIAPNKTSYTTIDIERLRQAIHAETKIHLHYQDKALQESHRTVWPFALAYYEHVSLLIAWCETKQAFRHFSLNSILAINYLEQHYPNSRLNLYDMWLSQQNQKDLAT